MHAIQIELWQLLTSIGVLVGAFLTFAFAAGRLLLTQIDRRLDERFLSLESARKTADTAMKEELSRHAEEEGKTVEQLKQLERDFLQWRADLPLNYVRREDYIRGQSVIEAKLDALFSEVKMVQIKGGQA